MIQLLINIAFLLLLGGATVRIQELEKEVKLLKHQKFNDMIKKSRF